MTNENGPSEYDKQNLTDIVAGHGDWLSAMLFRLIAKADGHNRERIRQGFPNHVAAFEEWERGEI